MLFMVIEHYSHGPEPVYQRAAERGRMLPDGLRYVDSWIVDDARLDRCFQLMETSDPELLDLWRDRWADLCDFEIIPVVNSAEAARRVGVRWDTPGRLPDHKALRFVLRVRGRVPVMSMPGSQIAADAAGRDPPGPSRAAREQVIEVLKNAFVQGRLTKEELSTRVGQACTSRTYAGLAEVTADLPGGPPAVRPPRQPARTRPRPSMSAVISGGAFAMIAALLGMAAAIASRSATAMITVAGIIALMGLLAFGVTMAESWRGRAR